MISQPNLPGWEDSEKALEKAERLKLKDQRIKRLASATNYTVKITKKYIQLPLFNLKAVERLLNT